MPYSDNDKIALVRELVHADTHLVLVCNGMKGRRDSEKAAIRRYNRAGELLLEALLGRKATDDEFTEALDQ